VPQVNQWDDHETHNNWYPHQILDDARYTERRTDVLSARAKQAFFECLPIAPQHTDDAGRIYRKISHGPLLDLFVLDMRTYKDPNDGNVYADPARGLLGHQQREWLERELAASRAALEGDRQRPAARARRAGPPGHVRGRLARGQRDAEGARAGVRRDPAHGEAARGDEPRLPHRRRA